MTDKTASDAEPTDLKSALIELRHAREEITRLRPFVDMVDQAQRAADAAAPSTPADQTALRDRIADIATPFLANFSGGEAARVNAGEIAAAVLAVLPEPADRAALLREVADICDEAGAVYTSKALNDHADGAYALMERFLRKADEAEYVATPCSVGGCEPGGEPCTTHERLMAHAEGDHDLCEPDCGTSPSRMADEAQQPETRKACGCGQDGCEYCDVDDDDDEPPCTCAAAGDCFAPAGHYADCPAAVSQPGKEA
jgi:hypothetical protein